MKKDKGILKSVKELNKESQSKKVLLRVRDSEDTNDTRVTRNHKKMMSSFVGKKEDDEDGLMEMRKSVGGPDRRPRMKCMNLSKSLPALIHSGKMLNSTKKGPGFSPKQTIKFNLKSVNLLSYSPAGDSGKSLPDGMLKMKGGGTVDCNCCLIY